MCGSNANIFSHFDAPILGITATPDPDMGSVYKSEAFRYTIKDALSDPDGPFLVSPRFRHCKVGVDLSSLRDPCC
jgi:type I site-specific restriction endonuclease